MPLAYPLRSSHAPHRRSRRGARAALAPSAAEHDRRGDFALDNLQALHEAGYLRLALPRAYGGEEADVFDMVVAQQILARADPASALVVGMSLNIIGRQRDEQRLAGADVCRGLPRHRRAWRRRSTPARPRPISAASRAAARRRRRPRRRRAAIASTAARFSSPARRACAGSSRSCGCRRAPMRRTARSRARSSRPARRASQSRTAGRARLSLRASRQFGRQLRGRFRRRRIRRRAAGAAAAGRGEAAAGQGRAGSRALVADGRRRLSRRRRGGAGGGRALRAGSSSDGARPAHCRRPPRSRSASA